MKAYELNIEHCNDFGNDDHYCLFSKGHHDAESFAQAAMGYVRDIEIEGSAHEWWRAIPDGTGEYSCRYVGATPKSKGSFPVTVIYQW